MCKLAVQVLLSFLFLYGGASQAASKRVLTSLYPIHIATLNVLKGVKGIEVDCLAPPEGGCLHDYSLCADDMVRLSKADVLIRNGMGAEAYMDEPLKRFPGLKVITASEGITPIVVGDEVNSHVWLGIQLHIQQVRRIAEGMAKVDPDQAGQYEANAAAYIKRLEALRERFVRDLKDVKNREIVTFHDAFPYFANEFGFRIVDVIQRHPGVEPGAGELKDTIQIIRNKGIKVVFAEPQYPDGAGRVIAAETGARLLLLDPVVTGPVEPDAYWRAMERNLAVLRESLVSRP